MRKLPVIIGSLSLSLACFISLGADPKVSNDTALARNLNTFNTITRYLSEVYVDSLRPDAAFNAAIGAMLNTVDPYTEYFNADQKETLQIMTTGAYGGIGAFIQGRDDNTFISMPIEGSPSYKAGLKPGDKVVRVDSTDVTGKPTDFTTRLLKGDPGTKVKVTVVRPYVQDSLLTFDIMRERVQDKSVPYYDVIDGIGYLKLTSFMDKSSHEVKTALESFKKNPELKGVVLDLRDNGGGLVEAAIEILGYFLPKNTRVLEFRSRGGEIDETYRTTTVPILPETPLVVLIDEGSASASEITAGAIQDLDRGVLVGRRSYGKGLVQSTLSLPYDGLLKVTTAKYELPSGRMIQALDYSHRNPDGSVARTPDSLTNEFRTAGGRIVRDGGGLVPDSTVNLPDYSRLLANLVISNQLFDYATYYAATHPSIPPARDFRVSDDIYADFVAFVDTAKIKSDKTGIQLLDELRKTANTEGFMTEELEKELDNLALLITPDLKRDLYNRRDEISEFLGNEIVGRYYNRTGKEAYDLNFDREFAVARSILENAALYNTLLGIKK